MDEATKMKTMEVMWKNILETMTCGICMEYLSSPVRQCSEGHLVCSPCMNRVSVCPQCKSRFINTRNRAIEQIADALIYPCANWASGCPERFENGKKDDHEKDCKLRRFVCPLKFDQKCLWTGLKSELYGHLSDKHPEMILKNDVYIVARFKGRTRIDLILFKHDEVFKVIIGHPPDESGKLVGYVMLFGSAKNAKNFKFECCVMDTRANRASFNIIRNVQPEVPESQFNRLDGFCLTHRECRPYIVNGELYLTMRILPKENEVCNKKHSKQNDSSQYQSAESLCQEEISTCVNSLTTLFHTAANGQVRALRKGANSAGLTIGGDFFENELEILVESVEDTFTNLVKFSLGRPLWWYLSVLGVAEDVWKAKAKERRALAEYLAMQLCQESETAALIISAAMNLVSSVAEWATVDMAAKTLSNEMKDLNLVPGCLDGSSRNSSYKRGVLKLISDSLARGGRQAVKKTIMRLNQATVEMHRPLNGKLQLMKEHAPYLDYSGLLKDCSS